jgi:hypothetical protein
MSNFYDFGGYAQNTQQQVTNNEKKIYVVVEEESGYDSFVVKAFHNPEKAFAFREIMQKDYERNCDEVLKRYTVQETVLE